MIPTYSHIKASTLGLVMTLAIPFNIDSRVTFKDTGKETDDGLTEFTISGRLSNTQLAELFNLADNQACPDNPNEEGCYSHTSASNVKKRGRNTYIQVTSLNGEQDTLNYGYRTKSGITFKREKLGFFKVLYEDLTARDYSDLFDANDIQKGNNCENTGVNNYRNIEGVDYLVAKCKDTTPSKANYTKINREHPAVEALLARDMLPGVYLTKKIKGKVKIITDKRTSVTKFLRELENVCESLDMNCPGLLNVMYFETRGTFDPRIKNPTGSATGLIQFVEDTAGDLGTSTRELKNMSALEQLKYVQRYFKSRKEAIEDKNRICDYSQPSTVALAVFYPGAIGKGDSYVIGQKQTYKTKKVKKGKKVITVNIPTPPLIPKYKQKMYNQNAGLDANNNGKITAGEYVKPAINRGGFLK